MDQIKHQAGGVVKRLTQIREKMNYILVSQSFDLLARSYKRICAGLTYFLNSLQSKNNQELRKQLHQCMKILNILSDSSEFVKFGHKFPLFWVLIQKYERSTDEKLRSASQQTLKRMSKNCQSSYYRSLNLSPITSDQQKFITSGKANQFLLQLTGNQNVIQDNQCVCCSQVFVRDFFINNANPKILNILELHNKNNIDKLVIQRYVNALCNKGGGLILIGVEKKDGCRRATGIRFRDWSQVAKKEQEVMSAFENIKPPYAYSVQKVLVHTNFVREDHPAEEWVRICFRIAVFPSSPRKLNYIQLIKNGFKTSYQIYLLDSTDTVVKVNSQKFYEKIHENYYSWGSFQVKNSHSNISCFQPHKFFSKPLNNYINSGLFTEKDLAVQEEAQQKVSQFQEVLPILDDNPKFKYKNSTLLVVTSKKNERYIQALKQRLKMKKKVFDLVKPFQKSFNLNGGRSIWMLSHQISFAQLKNLIAFAQKQNVLKVGAFKMMSVSKQLQIQSQKLTNYHQSNLIEKLHQRFGHTYTRTTFSQIETNQDQESLQKQIFSLIFNDYSQSIYAFMILEQKQLRAHFIKDTNNCKAVSYGY